jgi:DNA-binding winged helix-turn-helix (wHTH) protein
MSTTQPYIEVFGPDKQSFELTITKDRMTIGRVAQFNDIALPDDPQQLITRKAHCAIERDGGLWWVVDNGSVNRTFVRREGNLELVYGRALLTDGVSICLLGRMEENGTPRYWELRFHDPAGTRPASPQRIGAYLVYDWLQARLYRIVGTNRQEVRDLRPQEHKLIRYMDQRNRANDNIPVMCGYEELATAIWGDETGHSDMEINHIVWELRKKLENDPKNPQFLETVRGLGYRLAIRSFGENNENGG